MANDRMYLVHKPTGKCLYMGKHMWDGWYNAPDKEQIEEFYDRVGAQGCLAGTMVLAFEITEPEVDITLKEDGLYATFVEEDEE